MTTTRTFTIGAISEGTLLTNDLLDAFAYAMRGASGEADALAADIWDLLANDCDNENRAESLLDSAFEILDSLAPAYTYFGSHDGDGACFGFWPAWDSIEELPRVESGEEARDNGEDSMFVNDHGNVTIFAADGSVIWDCV